MLMIEKISDWEFKNAMKDTLVQPYQIIGGTLYRCRFFETEKVGYVFFDVHHTVSDGTSMKVFLGDVFKAFTGETMDKDYYYLMLKKREEDADSEFYEESRKYFEERTTELNGAHPNIDHESCSNDIGAIEASLGIEQPQMNAVERAYKISRNEFFITAAALAISVYNVVNDVKLTWIYNGREDARSMNTVGLLFRDLPVAFRFNDSDVLRDAFADVHDQVGKGIEHCCYPYVEMNASQGLTSGEWSAYSIIGIFAIQTRLTHSEYTLWTSAKIRLQRRTYWTFRYLTVPMGFSLR